MPSSYQPSPAAPRQTWGAFPALVLVACAVVATLAAVPAARAGVDEGIDYSTVEHPLRADPGDDIEVLELFWYGCPHCYHLEPALDKWRATLPAGVSFRRMPAAAAPHWIPHARAYYAAEQLGVVEQLHRPLFKALHDERRKLFLDEDLIAFAAEAGIDEAAFRAAYWSFPVDMQVREAADLVQRHGINGVPAVLVNGKYVTSATQAGSNQAMFDVIDHLIAKEQAAAAAPAAPAAPATKPPAPPPQTGAK